MAIKQYTEKEIAAALISTGGFVTHAARVLGCHYTTVSRAIENSPLVQEAYKITKENNLDIAENVIVSAMKDEAIREKMEAAKFMLRYKGHGRGYVKHSKVEVSEDLSKMMRDAEERTGQ